MKKIPTILLELFGIGIAVYSLLAAFGLYRSDCSIYVKVIGITAIAVGVVQIKAKEE